MNRLQAIYRSWAIPCAGQCVYAPRYRSEWLGKIAETAVRRRAEIYYQQLDALRSLRQQVRRDLLAESGSSLSVCGESVPGFIWVMAVGSPDALEGMAKSQSLVTLLGLDRNTLSSHRTAILVDIPFYRTGFSETGLGGSSQR
jgi:hypothetical protein